MKKRAQVSIELILGVSLAVIALIMILKLFGNNIETMVASSGMQRLFNPPKTVVEDFEAPTEHNAGNTEIDLATTADQGILERWANEDKAYFNYIDQRLAAGQTLSRSEIYDLAKHMTRCRLNIDHCTSQNKYSDYVEVDLSLKRTTIYETNTTPAATMSWCPLPLEGPKVCNVSAEDMRDYRSIQAALDNFQKVE